MVWEQNQQAFSRRKRTLQMAAWTPSNFLSRLEVDTWGSRCAYSCRNGSVGDVFYVIRALGKGFNVYLSCCCRSLWGSTHSHQSSWTASTSCTRSCGGVAQHSLW